MSNYSLDNHDEEPDGKFFSLPNSPYDKAEFFTPRDLDSSNDDVASISSTINDEVVRKLFKNFHSLPKGHREKKLLRYPVNYVIDEYGNTFLHFAIECNDLKISKFLLENKYNPDFKNSEGNTPLHLACKDNNEESVKLLLDRNANANLQNYKDIYPIQIASEYLNEKIVKLLISNHANINIINDKNETPVHIACRTLLSKLLNLQDVFIGSLTNDESNYKYEEKKLEEKEGDICTNGFSILKVLLINLNSKLVALEDLRETSPGTILHYFTRLNFYDGVQILFGNDFNPYIDPNYENKNKMTALWIASRYQRLEIANILIENGANVNFQDNRVEMTPLHLITYLYHSSRSQEILMFIDKLLAKGANPTVKNASGENVVHLALGTQDLAIISRFLDHIDDEHVNMKDENGDTLLHYAVGSMELSHIVLLLRKGANVMEENSVAEYSTNAFGKRKQYGRQNSKCIPFRRTVLQEALKTQRSDVYFDSLKFFGFDVVCHRLLGRDGQVVNKFFYTHIIAASREVRSDVLRILFPLAKEYCGMCIHDILLYSKRHCVDHTFRKTALEWAVENNDRLCTTEILHQEYEYHKESKNEGMKCLKQQLLSEELLPWTVETFSTFYEKTWNQKYGTVALFSLMPLLLSYCLFLYDIYSDIGLQILYFRLAFKNNFNNSETNFTLDVRSNLQLVDIEYHTKTINNTSTKGLIDERLNQSCGEEYSQSTDYNDYYVSFFVNLFCILLPHIIYIFVTMRFIKKYRVQVLESIYRSQSISVKCKFLLKCCTYVLWVVISVLIGPFYILYIAFNQLRLKYKHNALTKKSNINEGLRKSEFWWGVIRIVEAGFESSLQLMLQIWFISPQFAFIASKTNLEVIDMIWNGCVHWLLFGQSEVTYLEKSLGKIFLSLVTLSFGVTASYRTMKRGAIPFSSSILIFSSLVCQVLARLFSFGLLFLVFENFFPTVVIMFAIHYFFVLIFQLVFELKKEVKCINFLLILVNIFASLFVYVRIAPYQKYSHHHNSIHNTFFSQLFYFITYFIENLIMSTLPLHMPLNGIGTCIDHDSIISYIIAITLLSISAWILHILYYKCYGHPWADINGPQIDKDKFEAECLMFGKLRILRITCDPMHDTSSQKEFWQKCKTHLRCCTCSFYSSTELVRSVDVALESRIVQFSPDISSIADYDIESQSFLNIHDIDITEKEE